MSIVIFRSLMYIYDWTCEYIWIDVTWYHDAYTYINKAEKLQIARNKELELLGDKREDPLTAARELLALSEEEMVRILVCVCVCVCLRVYIFINMCIRMFHLYTYTYIHIFIRTIIIVGRRSGERKRSYYMYSYLQLHTYLLIIDTYIYIYIHVYIYQVRWQRVFQKFDVGGQGFITIENLFFAIEEPLSEYARDLFLSAGIYMHIYMHTSIYIYMYLYTCMYEFIFMYTKKEFRNGRSFKWLYKRFVPLRRYVQLVVYVRTSGCNICTYKWL
jgi:hypothetical protein